MALTADRMTSSRKGDLLELPVAAGVKIFMGALVMVDNGYARPGAASTTAVAVGRAVQKVDNTSGAAGAVTVRVERGTYLYKNATADPIAQADLLKAAYVVDDEQVAKTNGTNTRIRAGQIVDICADGVWVDFTK